MGDQLAVFKSMSRRERHDARDYCLRRAKGKDIPHPVEFYQQAFQLYLSEKKAAATTTKKQVAVAPDFVLTGSDLEQYRARAEDVQRAARIYCQQAATVVIEKGGVIHNPARFYGNNFQSFLQSSQAQKLEMEHKKRKRNGLSSESSHHHQYTAATAVSPEQVEAPLPGAARDLEGCRHKNLVPPPAASQTDPISELEGENKRLREQVDRLCQRNQDLEAQQEHLIELQTRAALLEERHQTDRETHQQMTSTLTRLLQKREHEQTELLELRKACQRQRDRLESQQSEMERLRSKIEVLP